MIKFFPLKKLNKHFKFVFIGCVVVVGLLATYLEYMASVNPHHRNPVLLVKEFLSVQQHSKWNNLEQSWSPEFRGQVNLHIFEDWCGSTVEQLRKNLHSPLYSHKRTTVRKLAVAPRWTDYRLRLFGYIHPYEEGEFQFAVASDDNSEFWLSRNEKPEELQLLAFVGKSGREWTAPGEFGKYPSQISQPVHLSMKRYYFEVLHKQDGGGTDHVEVAWRLRQAGSQFTLISSRSLSLYTIPFINESHLEQVLPDCIYSPSYLVSPGYMLCVTKAFTSSGFSRFMRTDPPKRSKQRKMSWGGPDQEVLERKRERQRIQGQCEKEGELEVQRPRQRTRVRRGEGVKEKRLKPVIVDYGDPDTSKHRSKLLSVNVSGMQKMVAMGPAGKGQEVLLPWPDWEQEDDGNDMFMKPVFYDQAVDWEQTFDLMNLDFAGQRSDWIDLYCNVSGNLILIEAEALGVVQSYMEKLNARNKGRYSLKRVVNVEMRLDPVKGSRYLLDLELQKGGARVLRLSQFVFVLNPLLPVQWGSPWLLPRPAPPAFHRATTVPPAGSDPQERDHGPLHRASEEPGSLGAAVHHRHGGAVQRDQG